MPAEEVLCDYEREREERMAENRRRMEVGAPRLLDCSWSRSCADRSDGILKHTGWMPMVTAHQRSMYAHFP